MAGEDYLWGRVASGAGAGNLQFDRQSVVDLMHGVRDLVAQLKGVQQLVDRDQFGPVSAVRDGSDVSARFRKKATDELAGALDSHLTVLDDQAAAFRAVGVRFHNTEVLSAEEFAKIRPKALSVSKEGLLGSGTVTTAYRGGVAPEYADIRWVDPMNKNYRQLYEWAMSINWYPALAAEAMWTDVAGHVRQGFQTYRGVLDNAMKAGPGGDGGWEGSGADSAREAVHRYINDIDTLDTAMTGVGEKLSTTAQVLQGAYNAFKDLPHPDHLTEQQQQQLEAGGLQAFRILMKVNYTSGLQDTTSGVPTLPHPVSPVTSGVDTPSRRSATPRQTIAEDRDTRVRIRPLEEKYRIEGFSPPIESGPVDLRLGPDVDRIQTFESGEPDNLSGYPGGIPDQSVGMSDQPRDLGQADNSGMAGPAFMGAQKPQAPAGHGGASLAGLPAQTTAKPAPRSAGGAAPGGGAGARGGVPRAGALTNRPAAQLFPRVAAPSAEPVGRAGPRVGVPGSPGAPAPAARRAADHAEDKEHKPAEYLNSEEHLGEAIGHIPPAYRPVVDR
ncbi:hypothetical protein AB0C34_01940 [Nocardia sp. NPDC049220]|uniref:hypothetical protein n=1 Tax=Nocardia sp. NPDC049220 TaxID=3155273 RepID=UPI0033D2EE90